MRAVPLRGHAALRALADRRRLTARVGLGRSRAAGRQAPRSPVLRGHVPRGSGLPLHASPSVANRVARRAARGSVRHDKSRWAVARLARARMPGRLGPWCSPSWPGGGGYRHRPRQQAVRRTASVRHMSVIMGSVEHATAYRGGLPRRIERADGTDPVGSSPRSAGHKRTQHRSAEKAQAAGENPSRVQSPCLSGRFCRPLALASSADRDKIPNHRADLLILRVVTGGRCWVRTNVG